MVVRRKQRPASDLFMQMFRNPTRQRQAVVRAGPAADFIKNHQTPAGGAVQDVGRFLHLHQNQL